PAELPFETYVDPKAEVETTYFDPTKSGWLSPEVGPSYRAEQPKLATLGIQKAKEEQVNQSSITPGSARNPERGQISAGGNLTLPDAFLDPFTKEVINEYYELDEQGNPKTGVSGNPIWEKHDFWFRVRFKIRMKD
ncbi:hypothetical protein ACFL02_10105, partial [Planctomycetota bacterium]